MTPRGAVVAVMVWGATGCQHQVDTPFPPGLVPLEANPVPDAAGARSETLRTATSTRDYLRAYGRGFVLAPPATVWAAVEMPTSIVAACSTDQQLVTPTTDPAYELVLQIHYVVHNVLTIEWDDQWRFGTIAGTPAAPALAMVKHQKVGGTSYITLSEGTIQLAATDDAAVTELEFVEHLDAVGGSTADLLKGMQHDFDAIVATSHGNPIPRCP